MLTQRNKKLACRQRRRDKYTQVNISIQATKRSPQGLCCSIVQIIDSARYHHHIFVFVCLCCVCVCVCVCACVCACIICILSISLSFSRLHPVVVTSRELHRAIGKSV